MGERVSGREGEWERGERGEGRGERGEGSSTLRSCCLPGMKTQESVIFC